MKKLNLHNSQHEPCLYTWHENQKVAVVALYVDDMLIASNDSRKLKQIKTHLNNTFEMKDWGDPKHFLGLNISRDQSLGEIRIDQADYAEKILERFNMKMWKLTVTPMESKRNRRDGIRSEEENQNQKKPESRNVPYREAIGSLLYLAGGTRPDISYTVNVLSRRQTNPNTDDWEDVMHLLRYIRGTTKLGLRYTAKSEGMEVKCDTSFADWTDSTSTSGYLILLFNDPIAWRSHKQQNPNTSTCKAEYQSMSETCRELISFDKAMREVTNRTFCPLTLWCDNESACKNTQMEGCHKLSDFDERLVTIHENLQFRERNGKRRERADTHGDYVKYLVQEGKITVNWVPSGSNAADLFTKPLERPKLREFTREIFKIDDLKFYNYINKIE